MSEYRVIEAPSAEYLGKLWIEFWKKQQFYPDSFNAHEFVLILTSPDTTIYELGPFFGCVFFTSIVTAEEALSFEEPRASAHILIWDKRYYRRSDLVSQICLDAMDRHSIRRLYAEIPDPNRHAYSMAVRVGFQRIGKIPKRTQMGGKMVDSTVLYALKSDLEQAGKEDVSDGRHRRVRTEERGEERQQAAGGSHEGPDEGHQELRPAG